MRSGRVFWAASSGAELVIRDEAVTSAITGARKKGQISETVKAADIKLAPDDIDEIEDLLRQREIDLNL